MTSSDTPSEEPLNPASSRSVAMRWDTPVTVCRADLGTLLVGVLVIALETITGPTLSPGVSVTYLHLIAVPAVVHWIARTRGRTCGG